MKNPLYFFLYFLRRWRFIIVRVCMGDSVALARYRWTLAEMENVTRASMGQSMGQFKAAVSEGDIYPDKKG